MNTGEAVLGRAALKQISDHGEQSHGAATLFVAAFFAPTFFTAATGDGADHAFRNTSNRCHFIVLRQ